MRRIRIQRHGLVPAVLVTIVGVLALYLASTWGWAAIRGTESASTGVGTLPDVVEVPPPSVATTKEYGPVGSVSMAYAGTDVRTGLLGELDPVWLLVSSQTGDTRALAADGLPQPAAGAVSVSPAGDRLAWVDGSSVDIYDTTTGETNSLSGVGASAVGAFSPDGSKLLVYADGIVVLDLDSGEALSTFPADADALRRAAWRPAEGDSGDAAVSWVDGATLAIGAVPGSKISRQSTRIPERSELAWSGSGDKLASLQPTGGAKRLFVSAVGGGGRVGPPRQVQTPQIALHRLVGFGGSNDVAVVAYALESGAVERVLDISLGGGGASNLTTLPAPGENWVGSATLSIATDTLSFGSSQFADHVWPWSYMARLGACLLLGLFLLGLFVTRRPRR